MSETEQEPTRKSSQNKKADLPIHLSPKKVKEAEPVQEAVVEIEKLSPTIGSLVVEELRGYNQGIATPRNYKEYAEVYTASVWVYASVFAVATGAAIVPWKVSKDGAEVTSTEDKVFQLLSFPNEEAAWYDLIESTFTYLELTGNAYWELSRNSFGKVTSIYLIRPDRMRINPRKDGRGIKSYIFQTRPNTKKHHFAPEDVIHFKKGREHTSLMDYPKSV